MKYMLISLLLLVVSCTPDTPRRCIPKYVEIECPECHGVGKVKADAGDRVVLGLITFGMGAMVDTKQCGMCTGSGVIRKRAVNDTIPN